MRAATRLLDAHERASPYAPVRDLIGDDAAAAYSVQHAGIARRVGAGATVVGRKVGLTSPAVQAQLGVNQPDFGVLLDDMGYPDGAAIPFAGLLQRASRRRWRSCQAPTVPSIGP